MLRRYKCGTGILKRAGSFGRRPRRNGYVIDSEDIFALQQVRAAGRIPANMAVKVRI
jgi:hypothetical protein